MNNMVDWTKPIQTRDGWNARFVCKLYRNGGKDATNLVVVTSPTSGEEYAAVCNNFGRGGVYSVINVPGEGWVNVYVTACTGIPYAGVYPTREDADKYNVMRIACIKWTEGQFDEA